MNEMRKIKVYCKLCKYNLYSFRIKWELKKFNFGNVRTGIYNIKNYPISNGLRQIYKKYTKKNLN